MGKDLQKINGAINLHRARGFSLSVENFFQPGFSLSIAARMVILAGIGVVVVAPPIIRILARGRALRGRLADRQLKQFIQLTTIEPNTTARRAIVNFNALPLRQEQRCIWAYWTLHLNILRWFFTIAASIAACTGSTQLEAEVPAFAHHVVYLEALGISFFCSDRSRINLDLPNLFLASFKEIRVIFSFLFMRLSSNQIEL